MVLPALTQEVECVLPRRPSALPRVAAPALAGGPLPEAGRVGGAAQRPACHWVLWANGAGARPVSGIVSFFGVFVLINQYLGVYLSGDTWSEGRGGSPPSRSLGDTRRRNRCRTRGGSWRRGGRGSRGRPSTSGSPPRSGRRSHGGSGWGGPRWSWGASGRPGGSGRWRGPASTGRWSGRSTSRGTSRGRGGWSGCSLTS